MATTTITSDEIIAQDADDLFGCEDVVVAHSRYTLKGERVRSRAGGIVSRATDAKGANLLVHTSIPSRNEQAIDLGAAATAIVHGVLNLDSLMVLFKREDRFDALVAAVEKAKTPVKK